MCWRPFIMYVIGEPVCGAGMNTSPTSLPVALSYARSIAPRCPLGVVKNPPSPAITSVLVTSTPMTYMWNDKQYIVIAVSGAGYSGELLAFRLGA